MALTTNERPVTCFAEEIYFLTSFFPSSKDSLVDVEGGPSLTERRISTQSPVTWRLSQKVGTLTMHNFAPYRSYHAHIRIKAINIASKFA